MTKSLKKDGRKTFFPRVIHWLMIFFQAFNPPLDDYWPLIHSMEKDNLVHFNTL